MSIRDHAAESSYRKRCLTCIALEELPSNHAEELEELISDYSVTASGISRGLNKEASYDLPVHSLRSHRRGECAGSKS